MSKTLLIGLAGVWLAGCYATKPPATLPPPPPQSVAQLQSEGQMKSEAVLGGLGGMRTSLYFSLEPQYLATLILQTAKGQGWQVEEKIEDWSSFYAVHLYNPHKPQVFTGSPTKQMVAVLKEQQLGKTIIRVGDDHAGQLPDELAMPLKETVLVYLNGGEPLTKEQREAAIPAPPPSPKSIIVTAGPLSQPYTALGEIHVNTVGMINMGSLLNDSLFRSPLERAASGPTPTAHTETMDKLLKEEARKKYGTQVDAVINAVYRTDPDGDVFASGLAVHFIAPEPVKAVSTAPPPPTLEQKLTELKSLREKGLITPEEYYEKRGELLKEF